MHVLEDQEKLARLRLGRCPGIGPVAYAKLIRRCGSATEALKALPGFVGDRIGTPPRTAEAAAELEALERIGGCILCLGEADYPEALEHTADAPPVLSVRGDLAILRRPAVALVGARNASGNGCALAKTMAAELAAAGLVVVSGLARGIDTAAHDGALAASGLTVAVIACGVDRVYPPENAALLDWIAAEGCIVSERPLGAEARAKDFPRRNRIIAGLSRGVVVVEAAPQSGSLITARLAAEQGREVMAVPGSPQDPRHRGTNQLLRDGATLVESAADVIEALRPGLVRPMARANAPRRPGPDRLQATAPAPSAPPMTGGLAELLGPTPIEVDELIRQSGLPTTDVHAALLDLELDGHLQRHPGNRVSLGAG